MANNVGQSPRVHTPAMPPSQACSPRFSTAMTGNISINPADGGFHLPASPPEALAVIAKTSLSSSCDLEEMRPQCQSSEPPCIGGWLGSDLDNINHDVFGVPADSRSPGRTTRSAKLSRQYQNQYRLVNVDGFMAIQPPLPESSSSSRTSIIQEGEKDNGYRSTLLEIPVEIRLQIYNFLLVSDCCAEICSEPTGLRIMRPNKNSQRYGLHPQILATCRQINQEGSAMLYMENEFQLQSYWRVTYPSSGTRPWPRSDSSPLKTLNLQSITRAYLFRDYKRWLSRSGELRALQELPSLKRLRVRVDLNDISGDVDLLSLWMDTIEAVSQHRPQLAFFETHLRLNFGREDHRAWLDRCRAKSLDFSIHTAKKIEVERWIRARHLFEGQQLAWSFTTETSQWAGPSCIVAFTVKSGRPGKHTNQILCMTETDDDVHISWESDVPPSQEFIS